jgi:choline dehydrogenase
MTEAAYDYIVCGAGTAGCLLANRLSRDKSKRVLVIEAGGRDNYVWVHIPVGYLYCIGNPRTDWLYTTEADPGLNGRQLRYPRGKVLGGCSSINGMIYMRGQRRDYDGWAAAVGDANWRWEHCLPYFRVHEDHWRGADEFHGAGGRTGEFAARHGVNGEWRVEQQRLSWAVLDAFAQAAQEAGIPATTDFNRGNNEGVGYFEVNQRGGIRWNASKAFLRPVVKRPNLQVWTGAQVTRLLIEHGGDRPRVTGIEALPIQGGEQVQAFAAREVVMAAGAVGTPQILQLSGIGPADLLGRHGIAVQHALPGVGGNLQDHLQIRSVYKVRGAKTLNELASRLPGKARIALEYALKRTGPMSMAPSQLGAFTRSAPGLNHANVEFHVQPLSLDAFGEPLHAFPAITASVCNLNPTSRGRIDIASPRPQEPPSIRPNYLATDADRQVAADSLRLTRRICAQPALAAFAPEEWKPGLEYQTDEELARLAGDIATTIFHPVGTTAMGHDGDPEAVLDPHLRLRDGRGGRVAGLRVVDAGAMPVIVSGNTNAPVLMMAEKAARWILADA